METDHSDHRDDAVIDAATEKVDQRMQWRRKEDVRRNATLIGLSALLFVGGIAWGTANAVVGGKLDRAEFVAHVAFEKEHRLVDSLRNLTNDATLKRIEGKVDSGNARVSRFICYKQPAYCQ